MDGVKKICCWRYFSWRQLDIVVSLKSSQLLSCYGRMLGTIAQIRFLTTVAAFNSEQAQKHSCTENLLRGKINGEFYWLVWSSFSCSVVANECSTGQSGLSLRVSLAISEQLTLLRSALVR